MCVSQRCGVALVIASMFCASVGMAQTREATVSLDEALKSAQQRQEDWQILEAQIIQAQARRRQVLARLLPQLTLNARVTRLGQEVRFGERVVRPQYDWGLGAQASVTLFDGSAYPAYSQADRVITQTQQLASWQRQLLSSQVEQAYHTLGAAQRDHALLEQLAQLRQLQLERAKRLVEAKLATSLDVERAQLALLQAELAAKQAKQDLLLASDQLALLMGQQAGPQLRVQSWAPPSLDPPATSTLELSKRADVDAARLGVEAAQLGERAIWWGLAPRLTFSINGDQGPATLTNPGFQWSMTLALAWTLYDGGALYARAQDQEQQAQILALRRQQLMRQASGQLLAIEREINQAVEAASSAQRQAEVAQRALELAERRFEQGLATQLDINDATSALVTAQREINRAHLRIWLARTQLRYLSDATQARALAPPP